MFFCRPKLKKNIFLIHGLMAVTFLFGCVTEVITPESDNRIQAGSTDRRMVEIKESMSGKGGDQAKIKATCLDGKMKGTKALRKKALRQAREQCKADAEASGCNFINEEATYFTYNATDSLGVGVSHPYSCEVRSVFTYPLKPKE